MAGFPSRSLKDPVRMGTEKVGILVYHFRLKPQSELHSHVLYLLCKSPDPFRQPVCIGDPVSKPGMFAAPAPEPSVVKNKEFYPCFLCLCGNLQKPLLIKIKICRLPVVDQDRSNPVSPVSPGQSLLIKPVIDLA